MNDLLAKQSRGRNDQNETQQVAGTLPRRVASTKIQQIHIDRRAVVYIRQSSPQQVINHTESTARQYALVDRAVDLGWNRECVTVIDEDQGQSGKSSATRLGFQNLLAEVSLDHVGIVFGIEMSRLARSCKDWHQLLELCGVFRTLLADADGIYDPTNYNDRLLLGLKGTMSEAELHILKSRMYEGKRNKARRGELLAHPPIGYVRDASRRDYVFDSDEQAQTVVRLIFDVFEEQGSLHGLLRYLVTNEIQMPVRPHYGPNQGQHRLVRPVNRYEQLSNYHELINRIDELRKQGATFSSVAEQIHTEGFHPPKRAAKFTGGMVSRLLSKRGLHGPRPHSMSNTELLKPEEFWLTDFARHTGKSHGSTQMNTDDAHGRKTHLRYRSGSRNTAMSRPSAPCETAISVNGILRTLGRTPPWLRRTVSGAIGRRHRCRCPSRKWPSRPSFSSAVHAITRMPLALARSIRSNAICDFV